MPCQPNQDQAIIHSSFLAAQVTLIVKGVAIMK